MFFHRYISQGGEAALQDNEERLKNIENRERQMYREKQTLNENIDSLKDDIFRQEVRNYSQRFLQSSSTCVMYSTVYSTFLNMILWSTMKQDALFGIINSTLFSVLEARKDLLGNVSQY
jgi:hypothetical protein